MSDLKELANRLSTKTPEEMRNIVSVKPACTPEQLEKLKKVFDQAMKGSIETAVIRPEQATEPIDTVLANAIRAVKGDIYTLTVDRRVSDEAIYNLSNGLRNCMLNYGIKAPLVVLTEGMNFAGVSEFDWSIALKLLKAGERVCRASWSDGYLYMGQGIIYHSATRKEWSPTQPAILANNWRRA